MLIQQSCSGYVPPFIFPPSPNVNVGPLQADFTGFERKTRQVWCAQLWGFFARTTLVSHPFWLKPQLLSFGYVSDP